MITGPSCGNYLLRTDRVPGEEPLPYVKTGRKTFIVGLVMCCHAALIIVPMVFLAISEMIRPPVYVMRLPTVDSVPNDNPEMSPHPSPLNKKPVGTPDKGKPLSEIPKIPDLVQPVDPPKPQPPKPRPPKPKPVVPQKTPIAPKPMPDSKKTAPVEVKPPKKPEKNTLLSPSDIKISHKRVKKPAQTPSSVQQNQKAAAEQQARNARNQLLAQQLRSLTGVSGGKGTPGGGGGPKGIVSKEVNDYYYKVEAFLKRRWEQPTIFGNARPKAIILFRVSESGRVLSARILEPSGNAAMDSSVKQLLRDLRTLPAPPRAMEFTVTMEIDR
ncbi:MAG: TonB family protein [Lentisphaeria bacterium]|nr:TonB family protein [Lentisphaeria bacterium]